MKPFDMRYLPSFPHLLEYCIKTDGVQGGTIHQYLPRLTVGGPAKHHRYGMRPIVQVYLDGKPLERAYGNIHIDDLRTMYLSETPYLRQRALG